MLPIDDPAKVFSISGTEQFNGQALEIFQFQYKNNTIYSDFVSGLGIDPEEVLDVDEIPFLPIEFFKSHKIYSRNDREPALFFESSGTTGTVNSRHYLSSAGMYEESFTHAFKRFFGPVEEYVFLCLLPSYLERPNSSLIFMLEHFVKQTAGRGSGFYLYDHENLRQELEKQKQAGHQVMLWGVSFALLDFLASGNVDFPGLKVIETGGMKGRRREMIREELHSTLREGFGVSHIYSEYGMTELLSQCYLMEDGLFHAPPWMRVTIRDINDPLAKARPGKTGGINIIDLANFDSCAFIATQDLGRCHENDGFEVLGRYDNSDIRGCSLMV